MPANDKPKEDKKMLYCAIEDGKIEIFNVLEA